MTRKSSPRPLAQPHTGARAALLVIAAIGLCGPARAVTIVPSGTYRVELTEICQGRGMQAGTQIVQSGSPVYSSVTLKISPSNSVSFSSAQSLTTNTLISASLADPGRVQQIVAFLTFTPSAAGSQTGKVSGKQINTQGSLVALASAAPPAGDMAQSSGAISGTYTATASSLSLSINGGTQTFQALYWKPSATTGVPLGAELSGLDGTNCTFAGRMSAN